MGLGRAREGKGPPPLRAHGDAGPRRLMDKQPSLVPAEEPTGTLACENGRMVVDVLRQMRRAGIAPARPGGLDGKGSVGRRDVTKGRNALGPVEYVRGGTEVLPPETFVQPHGRSVLGHDVQCRPTPRVPRELRRGRGQPCRSRAVVPLSGRTIVPGPRCAPGARRRPVPTSPRRPRRSRRSR